MTNSEIKSRFGINGVGLAKLTGQTPLTVSMKLRGREDRRVRLGAREAGILACFEVMTDEQKAEVDKAFDAIMSEIS